jgi:hypothetical protein
LRAIQAIGDRKSVLIFENKCDHQLRFLKIDFYIEDGIAEKLRLIQLGTVVQSLKAEGNDSPIKNWYSIISF